MSGNLWVSDAASVYSGPWASRPAAGDFSGASIFITDVGPSGTVFTSDGVRWAPLNGRALVAVSGTPATVTGTTAETTLATVTIPAGVLGANGRVIVSALWSLSSSINLRTPRVRFGGSVFAAAAVSTLAAAVRVGAEIQNAGSAGAQVAFAAGAALLEVSTDSNVVGSVDTSVDQVLVLSGQVALAAEFVRLEAYTVEILA